MGTISRAYDVERIAQPLIDKHHTHLREARILYVFTSKDQKRNGKIVLGKAVKMAEFQQFLSSGDSFDTAEGYELVVMIAWNCWGALNVAQRQALVDHELCHFERNEKDTGWAIRGHDVEEFTEVIARHGLWLADVQQFVETAQQLPLGGVA